MFSPQEKLDSERDRSFTDLNPYRGCEKIPDGSKRFNCSVGKDAYLFIADMRKTQGTMSTTVCVLFDKLITALRQNNITDYSHRLEFENFIANCQIVLQNQKDYDKGYDQGYTAGYLDAANKRPAAKLRVPDSDGGTDNSACDAPQHSRLDGSPVGVIARTASPSDVASAAHGDGGESAKSTGQPLAVKGTSRRKKGGSASGGNPTGGEQQAA